MRRRAFAPICSGMRRENGQTMAEYGVTLAVITSTILVALTLLSGGIQRMVERVGALL
jgi:Flp pilus assembly pilin Flp